MMDPQLTLVDDKQNLAEAASDSRINEVIDNDRLWKDFRREMSQSKVFTGMGVSQLSQAFMARRLGERANSEAKLRARAQQRPQKRSSLLQTARIFIRNSITMSRSEHVGGRHINRSASQLSDESSSRHLG